MTRRKKGTGEGGGSDEKEGRGEERGNMTTK
jgi:hypothetical protein